MIAPDIPDMPRVQAVLEHPAFVRALEVVLAAEADRRFCRHDLDHLLAVARIAWILNLERGLGLDREQVYAASLLHDIGRAEQYASGTPHDVAGEQLAAAILGTVEVDKRFSDDERRSVAAAVGGHRGGDAGEANGLAQVIREADTLSRSCWACAARRDCYWSDERKNLAIRI